jgi:UDPglucose--hexose-1-phosphate uridylyltransferase
VPELRKDPIIDRWVIISTERAQRPVFLAEGEAPPKAGLCPLCAGNEAMTPPEVFAIRPDGPSSAPNSPGWTLRVVPNKFPALRIEGALNKAGVGLYDRMNGVGAHEVIVETPLHGQTLYTMDVPSIQNVLIAYKERTIDLLRDKRFKFIMIFKNHGSIAGASLDHSHSQLIALPIVPRRVSEEINGGLAYYKYKDRCVFCDIIAQEAEENSRVIYENHSFVRTTVSSPSPPSPPASPSKPGYYPRTTWLLSLPPKTVTSTTIWQTYFPPCSRKTTKCLTGHPIIS